MRMAGSHDLVLVALSIVIAIAASYTALDLAGRIRASVGYVFGLWLVAAAIVMGGGIWSMHFVAMLAFSMPGVTVSYDVGLTILSLLVAIAASGAGFFLVGRSTASIATIAVSGAAMGLGIFAMHYLGMAAMRMSAEVSYDRLWVAISALIAIGSATAALWLISRNTGLYERVGAASLMGCAVAGMHYAGMEAAIFTERLALDRATSVASVGQTSLAVAVATSTFLILFLALVAATFDRRYALMAERESQALRRSEDRFRSLYEGTPLPLHSLDGGGRITQVSNAWLALMGYERTEVIGRGLIDFLTEASAQQLTRVDWKRLFDAGSIEDREYRVVTKDGRVLDVISAATIERDASGALVHVLGGLTDVTARKHAEEALRQAQKLEAIGQLTGGVAHDFNNLLAVILGNLELLSKRVPDDPKVRRLIHSAMEGATRGASLTQRLLAFARRQDLKPESVDVPALVSGMTDLLQRSIGPMVSIDTRFAPSLPCAQVDAHQLEMAILNLAVNARDAMPQGGSITISIDEHIELAMAGSGHAAGRYLQLSLADQGVGMDAATLARAIDPFFTTKGVGRGTGLGLSMVQGLAAQSEGWFELVSQQGEGTIASLYLPVAEGVSEQPPALPALPLRPLSPVVTLVVDDDNLVLANTVAMLDDLGHHVRHATSAAAAIVLIEHDPAIELLITDQLMPGMTGLELIQIVRRGRPDLPMLLVSGFSELERSADAGIPLLRKPFTQAQLDGAVRSVLMSATTPLVHADL